MEKEEKLKKEYFYIEDFEKYVPNTQKAKERLKIFEDFYNRNKEYFGEKILDLACGAGLFSVFLSNKGHKVLGVDIQDLMLNIAKKYENENLKFIKEDLTKFVPKENFDTAIFLGNSIAHFQPKEFVQIIKNIKDKIKYFVISYRDSIAWGFTGTLKQIIIEEKKDFDVIDLYKEYDGENGKIVKYVIIYPKNEKVVFDYYLYNPAIVEAIMFALGFKLVKREKCEKDMEKYFEIYEKTTEK